MPFRAHSDAPALLRGFPLNAHIAACVGALVPVYLWLLHVWTQGLFGGMGSAALTPFISLCLGYVAIRQRKVSSKSIPSAAIWLSLIVSSCLTTALVLLFEFQSPWFGLLTFVWPVWCIILIEAGFGSERRAQLVFPVLFLWFTLPFEPYLYEILDTPLQEITADIAVSALALFGYETTYWNAHTFYSDTFYIIVDETCSGMNLLVTLFMYALIFGWATRRTLVQRALLVMSVIPLALCSNGARVAAIYLLGFYGGEPLAKGAWHDGSGILAFLPTLVVIYGLGELMGRWTARKTRHKSKKRLA